MQTGLRAHVLFIYNVFLNFFMLMTFGNKYLIITDRNDRRLFMSDEYTNHTR